MDTATLDRDGSRSCAQGDTGIDAVSNIAFCNLYMTVVPCGHLNFFAPGVGYQTMLNINATIAGNFQTQAGGLQNGAIAYFYLRVFQQDCRLVRETARADFATSQPGQVADLDRTGVLYRNGWLLPVDLPERSDDLLADFI